MLLKLDSYLLLGIQGGATHCQSQRTGNSCFVRTVKMILISPGNLLRMLKILACMFLPASDIHMEKSGQIT